MSTARNRIMKMDEYKDSISYRASCQCGNPDCDMHLFLEIDKELKNITLNIYKRVVWASYWQPVHRFEEIWLRIKAASKMIFHGYVDVEESFIMSGEQIDDLIISLQEGNTKLKDLQNENVDG